jgi:type III secretion protein J
MTSLSLSSRCWPLAAACIVLLAGCKVELYSGLNEQEANEMMAVLSAEGIEASRERTDNAAWQLHVDDGRLGHALTVLRNHGLPRDRYVTLGDVFQKQGLVSTPSEERMRYIFAVSQELSQTLRNLDGVMAARVHVVIPANDPLSDKTRPSSAAVFIKHRPDTDMRLLVPAVKDMVAHSIEGLSHEQVSLTLVEARRVPLPTPAAIEPAKPGALFGVLSQQAMIVLMVLLLAGAAALTVLPSLLRKRGRDWSWLWRQVFRR